MPQLLQEARVITSELPELGHAKSRSFLVGRVSYRGVSTAEGPVAATDSERQASTSSVQRRSGDRKSDDTQRTHQASAAHIDVGGVEYLINERDGQVYYYDVNVFSDFVADAPKVVGFDPVPFRLPACLPSVQEPAYWQPARLWPGKRSRRHQRLMIDGIHPEPA